MMSATLREARWERWAQAATESLPLCKRGIEGDLSAVARAWPPESPLAPLLQRGETLVRRLVAAFPAWRPAHD